MRRSHKFKKNKSISVAKLICCMVVFGFLYFIYNSFYGNKLNVADITSEVSGIKLDVKEISSPNNKIKAYLLEDVTNPIISISFMFKNGGYANDDTDKQGLALMVASLLGEGGGEFNSQQLKEELDIRAIRISFDINKDSFEGKLLTTKENLDDAVNFLRLMLTQPRFDAEDVERTKKIMLEALKRQKEHPVNELQLEFAKELYGDHPYARNPLGNAEHINKITKTDLLYFADNVFNKRDLLVGIAGDVDAKQAGKILDLVFGELPKSGNTNFVRDANIKFDGQSKHIDRKSAQNIWIAAQAGVGRNHHDFYPLFVANHILGGSGLNSKLSQEIREKNGLTYGIYSYLSLDDKAPLLVTSFSATKDNATKAESLWREQLKKIQKDGISKDDLKKAKKYLISSYNLRFASISTIADILTAMQKYNLGLDFLQKRNENIANIRFDEVNNAIQKYFDPEKVIKAEIGTF